MKSPFTLNTQGKKINFSCILPTNTPLFSNLHKIVPMRNFLLFVFITLLLTQTAQAQCGGNSACTPVCIGPTSSYPYPCNTNFSGVGTNIPPCLDSGSSAENNQWFSFIASSSSITITINNGTCVNNQGIQCNIMSYGSCGDIGSFAQLSNCLNPLPPSTTGAITAGGLIPGNTYYFLVDGFAGDQCNFTFSAPAGAMLPQALPPPTITGELMPCKGTTQCYSASVAPKEADNYIWTIIPANAGTFIGYTANTQGPADVCVTWNKNYTGTTAKLCAKAKNPCAQSLQNCITITFKPPVLLKEEVKLCVEDVPYNYVIPFPGGGIDPATIEITAPTPFPIGATTTKSYNFEEVATGCQNKIDLTVTINKIEIKQLGTKIICEGDTIHAGSATDFKVLECKDEATAAQLFNVSTATTTPHYPNCDVKYSVKLRCIKITPKVIASSSALDCTTKQITLDAGTSIALPAPTALGTSGVKTYAWSGPGIVGATNTPQITIDKAGTYCVTVSYTFTQDGVTKTCSKEKCITILDNGSNAAPPDIPVGETKACLNGSTPYSYTIIPLPNTTYNWTVTGGTIVGPSSGPGLGGVNVKWTAAAAPYQLCVTATNVCGTSTPSCLNVVPIQGPPTPVIGGAVNICKNVTIKYGIAPIPNLTNIVWSVPAGDSIVSGQGKDTVLVFFSNAATNGTIKVKVINPCDSAMASINVVLSGAPLQPTITGAAQVCTGDVTPYKIKGVKGADTYVWTVNKGTFMPIPAPKDTTVMIKWKEIGIQKVCVYAKNVCDTSARFCFNVDVLTKPNGDAGIDTIRQCGFSANFNAQPVGLNNQGVANTGTWSYIAGSGPAGIVPAIADAKAPDSKVTVTKCGAYKFEWKETNGVCEKRDTTTVIFSQKPTGATSVTCYNVALTYTVTIDINGCLPPYRVLGMKQNVLVAGTQFISRSIGKDTVNYAFTIIDANGCATTIDGKADCNCVTKAGTMDKTLLQSCAATGNTVTAKHNDGTQVNDGNDTYSYVLHDNSGTTLGKILGVNQTGTFSFINDTTKMKCGQTYYISYVFGNDSLVGGVKVANLKDPCLSVAQGQPVRFNCFPKANAGKDDEICGKNYTLKALPSEGTGKWKTITTPSGTNILGPKFTPVTSPTASVSVAVFGVYQFVWEEDNNGCKNKDTVKIDFLNNQIDTSNVTYTCDATGEVFNFSVTLSGGNPPYTIKGGGQTYILPTAGAVFKSKALLNNSTTTFIVTDSKNCDTLVLNATTSCPCLTKAGALSVTDVCEGQNVTASVTGMNKDGNDVEEFLIVEKQTNLGNPLARNATGKFSFSDLDPARRACDKEYTMVHLVGNEDGVTPGIVDTLNGCTQRAYFKFKFICMPIAKIDKKDLADTCVLKHTFNAMPINAGVGTWTVKGNSQGIKFSSTSTAKTDITVTNLGTYTFVWTIDNNGCTASDEITFTFYDPSKLAGTVSQVCSSDNETYTVVINLTGVVGTAKVVAANTTGAGSAPITGKIVGNVYTSDPIPEGTSCLIKIIDNLACLPIAFDLPAYACPCTTFAGTPPNATLHKCDGDEIQVTAPADRVLDSNDDFEYYLHEGNGNVIVNQKAHNKTGKFSLQSVPGLQTEVTYYVSIVAGNKLGNGDIDLNHKCTDVTQGFPVIFHQLPNATLVGPSDICEGNTATLNLGATGNATFVVDFDKNGQAQTAITNITTGYTLTFTPTDNPTTLSLTKITDKYGCVSNITGGVTIMVHEKAKAGLFTSPAKVCQNIDTTFNLNELLSDADAGGTWSSIPPNQAGFNGAAGTFRTLSNVAGAYEFRYTVKGILPCPDDAEIVKIIINPLPNADAGQDKELNCDEQSVTLGGAAMSSGLSILYNWSAINGGVIVGSTNIKIPTANIEGTYSVIVTDTTTHCKAKDEVLVTANQNKITDANFKAKNPSCYGEKDAFIVVSKVIGGVPPYKYALNKPSGPYLPFNQFPDLPAGTDTIYIKDSKGCLFSDTVSLHEPEQMEVTLGDDVEMQLGDSLKLLATINIEPNLIDTVLWYPVGGVTGSGLEVDIKPSETRSYRVKVINLNGCSDEDDIVVKVKKPRNVYIPNAFNPDGTNNNTFFINAGIDVFKIKSFQVYDRWGTVVWSRFNFSRLESPANGWDGKFRGKTMNPAVFVFSAEIEFVDGITEIYKGDVALLHH